MPPFFMAITIDGTEVGGAKGKWPEDQALSPLDPQPLYKLSDDLTTGGPAVGEPIEAKAE